MQAKFQRDIRPGHEYNADFSAPRGSSVVVDGDADADDTVKFIVKQVKKTLGQTARVAVKLRGRDLKDTCRKIWEFCYWNIQYQLDTPGIEEVESPDYIWSRRETDCDGYTTMISGILDNLDIAHKIRVAAYTGTWQHVYVIVPVDGDVKAAHDRKKNRGSYYAIDPVTDRFDYEAPYSDNFDTPVRPERIQKALAGLETIGAVLPDGIVLATTDANGTRYGWDEKGTMYEIGV